MTHGPDCDGFWMHVPTALPTWPQMWRAACKSAYCGWTGNLYGNAADAWSEARKHEHSEPCPGGVCA